MKYVTMSYSSSVIPFLSAAEGTCSLKHCPAMVIFITILRRVLFYEIMPSSPVEASHNISEAVYTASDMLEGI
jgi:hypothetical protein